jgi:hypothetical protein
MSKFSQQFQKPSLSQNNQTQIMMANQVSLRVLICLDMVFIETLDLYISKVQSWLLILFQQLKKLGRVFQDSFNSFKNVSIFNMVSITSLDLNIFLSLDHRESLDRLKVLACQEISISISIGLDCQDSHAYNQVSGRPVLE